MKVTKFGHCCLLIEEGELRILTDPGVFSEGFEGLENIDVILITHEHRDHLHIDSLKVVLTHNPAVEVISNSAVGKLLEAAGIPYTVLEGTNITNRKGILIGAHDGKHGEIYEELGQVQNTGYLIAGKLFYPGDSFHNPGLAVEVLALPVAGPWCRIKDAIAYALLIKPKEAFPVHDGLITKEALNVFHWSPKKVLGDAGIEFTPLGQGESLEF